MTERDDGGYLVAVDRIFQREWRRDGRSIVDVVEVAASIDNDGQLTVDAAIVCRTTVDGRGVTVVEEVELDCDPTSEERAWVMAALREAAQVMVDKLQTWVMGGLN